MKYAHYSPLTGVLGYIFIAIQLIILFNLCRLIYQRSALKKPKHYRLITYLLWVSLACILADVLCWFNSWIYPPLAMPYDKNGEQLTIFAIILGICETISLLITANDYFKAHISSR